MKFLDPCIVEHIREDKWKLWFELRCIPNKGPQITVPAGLITDFASIPRGLWNVFPPAGKYAKAAILHDWTYQERLYPRRKCDDLFLEGMIALRVPRWKQFLMYQAVRAFGERTYRT